MLCFGLSHRIHEGVSKMNHHLGPEPWVIGEDMMAVDLVSQPVQFMHDPILDIRSLDVRKETQHPFVWFCHDVDGVIETPVDLPLRQEQLCPVTFSVEYLWGLPANLAPPPAWPGPGPPAPLGGP